MIDEPGDVAKELVKTLVDLFAGEMVSTDSGAVAFFTPNAQLSLAKKLIENHVKAQTETRLSQLEGRLRALDAFYEDLNGRVAQCEAVNWRTPRKSKLHDGRTGETFEAQTHYSDLGQKPEGNR